MVWQPTLTELPEQPGVYRFQDRKGRILYIGKALNLRRRIASYFQRGRRQPARLRRMLARARAVTFSLTGSELEALLLESRLIKQGTPPFNQLSLEYTVPTFVKLTLAEPFPRLLLTHDFEVDGSHYLGPFPRFDIAEVVLAALQRLVPLRTCEGSIVPGVFPLPCSAFHVKKCVGPCVSHANTSAYGLQVAELLALLMHGHAGILRGLIGARERAAAALRFERAGHLHALFTAFDEVTVGRPLALMPVAHRNLAVLFRRSPSTHEVFLVRHGLFVERVSVQGAAQDLARLRTALARCYVPAEPIAMRDGKAAVDELRIVGGWLHRTCNRARWVTMPPQMCLTDALEAISDTIFSAEGTEITERREVCHRIT
ncbi:MAG: GIY-YIG nuclease family protein [Candidatus Entotheonellia bacterium]